jgi:GAF domain-containing protein
LILIFALTIFPGIREELRSFADRNLYVSRFEYRTLWQRLNIALSAAADIEELAVSLHDFLRSIFGPIRMQLWVIAPDHGSLVPIAGEHAQVLRDENPLVRAVRDRPDPVLITGEASRVEDIPLHVACEEMSHRYGLRVFFPIHAGGVLVGILACGSGGGRVLHPEDIELLRTVTEHLGGVLGVRGWNAPLRDPAASSPAVGRSRGGVEA